jgi:hypothetical protein
MHSHSSLAFKMPSSSPYPMQLQRRVGPPPGTNFSSDLPTSLLDAPLDLEMDFSFPASFAATTNITSNISRYLTSPFTYFSDVISLAEPNAPRVEIVNDVDGEKPPVGWWYSNEMWLGSGVLSSTWEGIGGCGCAPGTGCASAKNANINWSVVSRGSGSRSGSVIAMVAEGEGEGNGNGGRGGCSCLRRQQAWSKDSIPAFAYREKGMLKEKYVPVWECGVGCGCGEGCRNRVVQKGRKISIRIQKTRKYGWGTLFYFIGFPQLSTFTWKTDNSFLLLLTRCIC